MGYLRDARAVWRTLVVVVTPAVLSPLVSPQSSQESKCGFVLGVMAVYWITESLPLAVTALLPVLLLPLLGVMASKQVCSMYFKESSFLLLAGLFVAMAIEENNLHKRFALRLLLLIGVHPRRLLAGLMLVTACLSMWMTSTAATAAMTPIAHALVAALNTARQGAGDARTPRRQRTTLVSENDDRGKEKDVLDMEYQTSIVNRVLIVSADDGQDTGQSESQDLETPSVDATPQKTTEGAARGETNTNIDCSKNDKKCENDVMADDVDSDGDDTENDDRLSDSEAGRQTLDEASVNMLKAASLGVCYSANIGGLGTLVGAVPNIVYKTFVEMLSRGEMRVPFLSWSAVGLPVVVCCLLVAWLWLLLFLGVGGTRTTCRGQETRDGLEQRAAADLVTLKHGQLGAMTFCEKVVLGHFLVLVVLWFTRSPGFVPGWSTLFLGGYVSDAVPAVLAACSLFVFPKYKPTVFEQDCVSQPSVLEWSWVNGRFPWRLLLLTGGSLALTEAMEVSGLSQLIAQQLVVRHMPKLVACVLVTMVASVTAEVVSHTVVASLLLPIAAKMCVIMHVHPVYLLLPVALGSSCALAMPGLPAASPSSSTPSSRGQLTTADMVKTGSVLKVVSIVVVVAATNTLGQFCLDLGQMPGWALVEPDLLTNSVQSLHNFSLPGFHGGSAVPRPSLPSAGAIPQLVHNVTYAV